MIDFDKDAKVIRMYGVIGEFDDEISAVDFMKTLDNFTGEDLTVLLKSPGGEIDDGLSIYGQLQAYPGKVTMEIDTQAASIATIVAMGADEIVMRKRSEMFIHDPWTLAMGNSMEFRNVARLLDELALDIAGVYQDRTGIEASEWMRMMRETRRFNADQAVAIGLADRVLDNAKGAKMLIGCAGTQEEPAPPTARLKAGIIGSLLDKRHRTRKAGS